MNLKTQTSPLSKENLADFTPVRMLEVEISRPLPALAVEENPGGMNVSAVMALIRMHQTPVGMVAIELPLRGLTAQEFADQIWHIMAEEINLHLSQDGLKPVAGLNELGIYTRGMPQCVLERQVFLESAPFVSVLMATRDRPEQLKFALDSVLASEYPNFEVIVVDNAPSSQATARMITENYAATGRVRYVREDQPGLSAAHNRGILEVRGSYVAITDDDVLVDRLWLAELIRGFYEDDHVGCVTGMTLPVELQTPAQLWFEQFGGFSKGFTQKIYDLQAHRPDDPLFPYTAGKFGTGANMAYRTSLLLEMGGFDPATGIGTLTCGGDDLAAFFEVLQSGYRLVYRPKALLYHRHRRDYPGLKRQIYGYGVGLTAFLTKTLIDHPNTFFRFLSRLPYGLYFTLSAHSPKNSKKHVDYPPELTRLERRGMVYGPLAYLRSRWNTRRLYKQRGAYQLYKAQPAPLNMPSNKGELSS